MSGELQVASTAGLTLNSVIYNRIGQVWNTSTSAFVTYATANLANYVVALTELGTASGVYTGTFPSAIVAGIYSIVVKRQTGGAAAEADPLIASGDYNWSGTVTVPLSDLCTSGQLGQLAPTRMSRSEAISGFMFKLVSSSDHVTNFTSGTVSGQISRDGAAFGALQSGTVTEVGLGFFRVNLTSGDLNAKTIGLSFSAVGISGGSADQRDFAFITQRI
jgi:hypothetical protein